MAWNFQTDRPIYAQILEEMKRRVAVGIYEPGEKIPPVRELAMEAAVNPNTMQKALTELEALGLVESQRTTGRFVTENTAIIRGIRNDIAKEHLQTFYNNMKKLGYTGQEMMDLLTKQVEEEK